MFLYQYKIAHEWMNSTNHFTSIGIYNSSDSQYIYIIICNLSVCVNIWNTICLFYLYTMYVSCKLYELLCQIEQIYIYPRPNHYPKPTKNHIWWYIHVRELISTISTWHVSTPQSLIRISNGTCLYLRVMRGVSDFTGTRLFW